MWIKSSFCSADKPQCVEVKLTDSGEAELRDSKLGPLFSPVLSFTAGEWEAFVAGVKAGEFDRRKDLIDA
jgi:hypothetical protein